ncbi:MAG: DUF1295 domain-containing protein [Beijerinckiaceae bacterium]
MSAIQISSIVAAGIALSAIMAVAWAVQRRTGQSGWVDAFWTFGTGFAGAAVALTALAGAPSRIRPLLVAALMIAWCLRLGLHIVSRTRGGGDDPRYAKMKEDWGDAAPRKMFALLQYQALASIPLFLAIAVAAGNSQRPPGWQDALAALVFCIAVAGEGLADRQLRDFARNPDNSGKVCKAGLWRWSRHPNYFFEWLVWMALPVFAVNLDGSYPWGWLSLAAPASMYWLLTKVSGVPLLEEHMEKKYGDPYREYQRTTSAFFPLPPAA